jgi:hypothetical protein
LQFPLEYQTKEFTDGDTTVSVAIRGALPDLNGYIYVSELIAQAVHPGRIHRGSARLRGQLHLKVTP